MIKTTKTDYLRFYKRNRKGKPWLNDIEEAGAKRGLSMQDAVDRILERVVSMRMLKSLLDDEQ
jgi:hypothetical protein